MTHLRDACVLDPPFARSMPQPVELRQRRERLARELASSSSSRESIKGETSTQHADRKKPLLVAGLCCAAWWITYFQFFSSRQSIDPKQRELALFRGDLFAAVDFAAAQLQEHRRARVDDRKLILLACETLEGLGRHPLAVDFAGGCVTKWADAARSGRRIAAAVWRAAQPVDERADQARARTWCRAALGGCGGARSAHISSSFGIRSRKNDARRSTRRTPLAGRHCITPPRSVHRSYCTSSSTSAQTRVPRRSPKAGRRLMWQSLTAQRARPRCLAAAWRETIGGPPQTSSRSKDSETRRRRRRRRMRAGPTAISAVAAAAAAAARYPHATSPSSAPPISPTLTLSDTLCLAARPLSYAALPPFHRDGPSSQHPIGR